MRTMPFDFTRIHSARPIETGALLKRVVTGAVSMAAACMFATMAQAQEACQPQNMATKYPDLVGKVIKIGADPQNPPYVMRDKVDFNKIVGLDADLARAVFDCVGVKYEFFLGGWSGLLPAVMSGQIEVMWDNLAYRPDRAKSVDYVLYMKAGNAALVPSGNPKGISKMVDICGVTVAFAVASVEEQATRKQDNDCVAAGRSPVNMMPFQDLAAGMRLLENGRTDVLMWDLGFIDSLVAENPAKYTRAFAFDSGVMIGAGLPKGSDQLRQAVFDGLKIIQSNGQQKAIFEKYGLDPAISVPAEIKVQ